MSPTNVLILLWLVIPLFVLLVLIISRQAMRIEAMDREEKARDGWWYCDACGRFLPPEEEPAFTDVCDRCAEDLAEEED